MGGRKLTLRASLVLAQRPTVVLIEVLVCSSISTRLVVLCILLLLY